MNASVDQPPLNRSAHPDAESNRTPGHMHDATPALQAVDIHRAVSSAVTVGPLSLQLHRGDILGLLGLNGAGKSTTLRLLCGILVPDGGSVLIAGISLDDDPLGARARLGFLPDQPPLYNHQRVADYLLFAARLRRLSRAVAADRVDQVISDCGLESVRMQRIATLSKGFRQRVGLAQAMVHEPDVLLLDEPANGLDPEQLDTMRQLLLSTSQKAAIVFSTHLLSEAQQVCNRIAVVHEGKLIADRPADGEDLSPLFHSLTQGRS